MKTVASTPPPPGIKSEIGDSPFIFFSSPSMKLNATSLSVMQSIIGVGIMTLTVSMVLCMTLRLVALNFFQREVKNINFNFCYVACTFFHLKLTPTTLNMRNLRCSIIQYFLAYPKWFYIPSYLSSSKI